MGIGNLEILRSWIPNNRPPSNRLVGEPYVNFADMQFGVMNNGPSPTDLIAVRYWSSVANYNPGNHVISSGSLYWARNANTNDNPINNSGNWARVLYQWDVDWLPLSGGTLTGPLTIDANPGLQVNGDSGFAGNVNISGGLFLPNGMSIQYDVGDNFNTFTMGYGGPFIFANNVTKSINFDTGGVNSWIDLSGTLYMGGGIRLVGQETGYDFALDANPTARFLFWSQGAGTYTYYDTSGGYLYFIMGNTEAAWIGPGSTGIYTNGIYQGPEANGGALIQTIDANNISFGWNGQIGLPQFRIDGGGWIGYPVSATNAKNMGYYGGAGGPTNVGLTGTDFGGNQYNIYVDYNSDARIKENIRPTRVDALGILNKIEVDQYDVKAEVAAWFAGIGEEPEKRQERRRRARAAGVPIGLIAQKVQALIPSAIAVSPQTKADMSEDSPLPDNALSIIDHEFTPYLIRAIQQLTAEVERLKAQVRALTVYSEGGQDGRTASPATAGEVTADGSTRRHAGDDTSRTSRPRR